MAEAGAGHARSPLVDMARRDQTVSVADQLAAVHIWRRGEMVRRTLATALRRQRPLGREMASEMAGQIINRLAREGLIRWDGRSQQWRWQ